MRECKNDLNDRMLSVVCSVAKNSEKDTVVPLCKWGTGRCVMSTGLKKPSDWNIFAQMMPIVLQQKQLAFVVMTMMITVKVMDRLNK